MSGGDQSFLCGLDPLLVDPEPRLQGQLTKQGCLLCPRQSTLMDFFGLLSATGSGD